MSAIGRVSTRNPGIEAQAGAFDMRERRCFGGFLFSFAAERLTVLVSWVIIDACDSFLGIVGRRKRADLSHSRRAESVQ